MIGLIVLGLAFVFFLVVAFFAAKTWHVGHVVAMSFLFLFTLLTLYMTATLMRTYAKYRPEYAKTVKSIESLEKTNHQLEFGNLSEPAGEGSLVGERTLAKVESTSRGRMWGNVRARVAPDNSIVMDMSRWANDGCMRVGQEEDETEIDEPIEPVPDEGIDGEAADAPAQPEVARDNHGIVEGQFVYGFKEFPISQLTPAEKEFYFAGLGEGEDAFPNKDTKGLCRVPVAYIGKFLVQKVDAQSVSVVPASQLTPGQRQQIANPNPWVIYEKLPTDSHDVFAGVEQEKLASLIPAQRLAAGGLRIPPAAYNRMIGSYAADGKEFTGQVTSPLRIKVKVKFLKEHEQVVDLVVEGELPPADTPFDVQGRAQINSLLQGEPTKFAKDDEAWFDAKTADDLVRRGLAERVGNPVFSRQLSDFEYSLDEYQVTLNKISVERSLLQGQVDALTSSLERLQEQIDKHRQELDLLRADQQGFDVEKSELEGYRSILRQRIETLRGEVDSMISI